MGHRVYVTDIIAIQCEVELPDACPHCKTKLELGVECVTCWTLRPLQESLRLTTVAFDNGSPTDTLEVRKVGPPQGEYKRLPMEFMCKNCKRSLVKGRKGWYRWNDFINETRSMNEVLQWVRRVLGPYKEETDV